MTRTFLNWVSTLHRPFFLMLLFAVGTGTAHAAADEARLIKDLEFATVDGNHLKLDLYLPAASDPPLVVWIHGGGWQAGSKDGCSVKWLTEYGYAVASISYRLTDKAIFPAQIHDCKAAVRWLRANAARFGYGTEHVGVAGSSAGGHLAALMGTSGDVKELEGTVGGNLDQSSRVDAVVDFFGATDFVLRSKTQPHRANKVGSVVYRLLGGGADQKVELAKLASAAFHVTPDDPPFLVFHGDKDQTVLLDQSQRILEVYSEAKLPIDLQILKGAAHGGDAFFSGRQREIMVAFLDKHLRSTSSLPRSTPESQGVSSARVRAFVEAAEQSIDTMHSFMLVRHGHVVAEGWWSPEAADKPHVLWSLSKSFTSTAVGLAATEGKLNIDDKVLDFFPEDAPENPSANLKAMRVRDLLTMSTGHAVLPRLGPDDVWTKKFLAQPVPYEPGSTFLYNTPGTYMQSAIVQTVTGQNVRDYLMPRLFEPLGIEKPRWDASPQGISIGGYGLYLCTEDIAKFGQLLLQKGQWDGKQLVPQEWVEAATSKQVENDKAPSGRNPDWRQGYGFQFWRCRHGVFRGDGKDGQFCIVLPQHDAVIAMTALTHDLQGQLNLVWEHVLPAFHEQPLPPNDMEWMELKKALAQLKVTESGN